MKRFTEIVCEMYATKISKPMKICVVRPANIYGEYDDFEWETSHVIPALIRKVVERHNPLEVWGDGSPVRDFIHADDVALGMLFVVENKINEPLNLGSGVGYTIREVVDMVVKHSEKEIEVKWLSDKPSGDKIRLFDMSKANSYNFKTKVSLDEGIKRTTEWFKKNKESIDKRYNVFINH